MIGDMMMPIPAESPSPERDGLSLSESAAKKLKERLKISERFKEKEFKPHYDNSGRLLRGIHWPTSKDNPGDECRVVVNMIYPIVSTKVSTVGFRYPEFNLTPMTMESQQRARLAASAMRYEWKISKTQREAVRALRDKEVYKFGIVMTGWEFRTEGGINRKDGREDVAGENPDQGLDFVAMAEQVSLTGEPTDEISPEEVLCDQFYCKRICPDHFLLDPEGDWVLDNHEYCGYTEMVPLEDLKNDKRLKHTRDLKGSSRGLNSFLDKSDQEKPESDHPTDIKRVKVYHYFEKRRKIYAMFCDEHDKALLVENWSWEHGRYPFRTIHAVVDEDKWYDTSPVEMVQSQQEELNLTRTMLRTHIRRSGQKFSSARGMLDRIAKQQLKSAAHGALVEHNGGPEAKVIMPIESATLDPEVFRTDEWAIRDMRFTTGLDEYDTNTVGKTRRTAAEVQQIRQAGGSRAQNDAQQFEQFCAEIGEDLLDLLMQYSQKAKSIPVYGPYENVQEWSEFTSADIKGEYLVNVYIGSTQPSNTSEQQQTYAWLLQTLGQFAQMPDPASGMPLINLKALIKGLLANFPDIHNVDEILAPDQPPALDPMQAMMQQGLGPAVTPEGLPLPPNIGAMMQPRGV
jgi:hypothetical protein